MIYILKAEVKPAPILYTIGHSTRTIEEFIDILKTYRIKQLVDIRSLPGSRRHPQYDQELLEQSLSDVGIKYFYIKSLGGLRAKPSGQSINQGWRNASFRNYADYMQTDDFKAGIEELKALVAQAPTTIMCAEAVPWRCHRSLVGDAMVVRGCEVYDLISRTNSPAHKLTSFALVEGSRITYPFDPRDEQKNPPASH